MYRLPKSHRPIRNIAIAVDHLERPRGEIPGDARQCVQALPASGAPNGMFQPIW
jgi:hypothetical protein